MNDTHRKLIKVAAELARGPNLDERFELDERLPKWVHANIERICDRQRQLCCTIRDNADKLAKERDEAIDRLAELNDAATEHLWRMTAPTANTLSGEPACRKK